jgi:hypothetical protein
MLSVGHVARVRVVKIVRNFYHGGREADGRSVCQESLFDTKSSTVKTVLGIIEWINVAHNRKPVPG